MGAVIDSSVFIAAERGKLDSAPGIPTSYDPRLQKRVRVGVVCLGESASAPSPVSPRAPKPVSAKLHEKLAKRGQEPVTMLTQSCCILLRP